MPRLPNDPTKDPADDPAHDPHFEGPSRSARKRDSEALQDLGESLLTLRAEVFAGLDLPPRLRDAVEEARRLTARGAIRRQFQFIGKLMRQQDETTLAAIRRALEAQHLQSAREKQALHRVEEWRERLLAEDAALGEWLGGHPGTDAQQLRALIRQARKDARHGRAYRELFRLLRGSLQPDASPDDSP